MFFRYVFYIFLAISTTCFNVQCISLKLKQLIATGNSKKFMESWVNATYKEPKDKILECIDQEIEKTKKNGQSFFTCKKDLYRGLTGTALIGLAILVKSQIHPEDPDDYINSFALNRSKILEHLKHNPKTGNLPPAAINIASNSGTNLMCTASRINVLLKSVSLKFLGAVSGVTGVWMVIRALLKSNNNHTLKELVKMKEMVTSTKSSPENRP